jgi:DNA primase
VEIVSKAVAQGVKAQPKTIETNEPQDEDNSWRPDPHDARLILEREVLKARLQESHLFAGTLWSDIEKGAFTHPAYREMGKTIDDNPTLSIENISDEKIRTIFTELSVEPIHADGKPTAAYVESIVARLREVTISRSIAELKSSLQRLNPLENEIEYNAAFAQLVALESARRNLHDLALGSL